MFSYKVVTPVETGIQASSRRKPGAVTETGPGFPPGTLDSGTGPHPGFAGMREIPLFRLFRGIIIFLLTKISKMGNVGRKWIFGQSIPKEGGEQGTMQGLVR